MTTRKPTHRQLAALRRIRKHSGRDAVSPDVARQLIKRGLVVRDYLHPTYERTEWNRVVAVLWNVCITPAGAALAEAHPGSNPMKPRGGA